MLTAGSFQQPCLNPQHRVSATRQSRQWEWKCFQRILKYQSDRCSDFTRKSYLNSQTNQNAKRNLENFSLKHIRDVFQTYKYPFISAVKDSQVVTQRSQKESFLFVCFSTEGVISHREKYINQIII